MSIPRQLGILLCTVLVFNLVGAYANRSLLITALDRSDRTADQSMSRLGSNYQLLDQLTRLHSKVQALLRVKDADDFQSAYKSYQDLAKDVSHRAEEVGKHSATLVKDHELLMTAYTKVTEKALTGNGAAAVDIFLAEAHPRFEDLLTQLDSIQKGIERGTLTQLLNGEEAAHSEGNNWFVGTVVGSFLLYAGGWFIRRRMVGQMNQVTQALTQSVAVMSRSAQDLAQLSQGVASAVDQQASSLHEASSALSQVGGMTDQTVGSAQRVTEAVEEARKAADQSTNDIEQLGMAMEAIRAANNGVAKIIKTIDEIAFQTNILALNAAVEAARAGEAGAGFAVVAEEVRSLAQRSASAARETNEQIRASIDRGTAGCSISQRVAESLSSIVMRTRALDQLVAGILTSSQQQKTGVDQVVTAVHGLDSITQQNAASAQQSAGLSQQIEQQSHSLTQAVARLAELLGSQVPQVENSATRVTGTNISSATSSSGSPSRSTSATSVGGSPKPQTTIKPQTSAPSSKQAPELPILESPKSKSASSESSFKDF